MTVKFTNNASSTLASAINTTATSLTVADASTFPSLSGADDYCYLTIQQATGTVREVVKATARSGNNFTIQRAFDNTTARAFSASDIVELRMTAALLQDVIDQATVEGIKTNYQFVPTAGQTQFSGADNSGDTLIINDAELVNVYMNGVRLVQGSDYTVSSSNNRVTLTTGATTADIIDIEVFGNFTGQSGAAVGITGGAISGTAITTGSINNTPIGATQANTVAATTLTANSVTVGNTSIASNTSHFPNLTINNNGYIGSANNTTALQIATSGDATFGGTVRGTRLGANASPSADYGVTALQNGSMTHAGYFQANGDDFGVEVNATASGGYSSSVLYVRQSSRNTGGNLARFANSDGDQFVVTTSGEVVAGTISSGQITANSGNNADVAFFDSTHATTTNFYIRNSRATTGNAAAIYLAPANNVAGAYVQAVATEDFSANANRSAKLVFGVRKDGTFAEALTLADSKDATFSGSLLVGTTDSTVYNNSTGAGVVLGLDDSIQAARANDAPLLLNRQGSDGSVAVFYRNGSTVGSISSTDNSGIIIGSHDVGLRFRRQSAGAAVFPRQPDGSTLDATLDLGISNSRFKDVHLSRAIGNGPTGLQFNDGSSDDLIPFSMTANDTVDATISLGIASKRFKNLYLSNTVFAGQVGINESDPTQYHANADDLVITGTRPGITLMCSATDRGTIHFADGTSGGAESAGFIVYRHTENPNDMLFGTDDGVRMRIQSSGVTVGNFTANALLHIGTSATGVTVGNQSTPALQIGGSNNYRFGVYTDQEAGYIENKNGDNGLVFRVKTLGEAMRITGGTGDVTFSSIVTGNKGVHGTSVNNVDDGLVVKAGSGDSASSRGRFSSNGADVAIGRNIATFPGTWTKADNSVASAGWVFGTSGAAAFYQSNAGDTTPLANQRLRIMDGSNNGTVIVGSSTTPFTYDATKVTLSGGGNIVAAYNLASTNEFWILNNLANIASGVVCKVDFRVLNVSKGYIGITSTGVQYNQGSDYRLKDELNYDFDATELVKKIKPVQFRWLADMDAGIDTGFIAHELQEVHPFAVSGEKDAVREDGEIAPQGVDASKLVGLLTKALQEALSRIDSLEGKVKALEEAA